MPFQIKDFQKEDSVSLQSIAGAYYRIHRIHQNISLSFLADEIHMNKGFLSELENGKRHFPAGFTKQLNDALDTNFCEDEKRYAQARKYLLEIFQNFFLERTRSIETIYKKIEEQEEAIKDSYGFFVFLLMKLFYYLRVERVDENVLTIKEIIDKNLRCLQKDEQLIKSFPICRTIEITVQRAKTALFAWSIRRNTSKPRFYSLILLALATFSACKLCKIGS